MIFCLPCLALLLYFGIMGIFFPRYRVYIKEGWRCFIDKLKGKKCPVSFDNRMRIAFSSWLTQRGLVSPGRFFYKKRNFDAFMSAFIVIFTIISIYLLFLFISFLLHSPCEVGSTCTVEFS